MLCGGRLIGKERGGEVNGANWLAEETEAVGLFVGLAGVGRAVRVGAFRPGVFVDGCLKDGRGGRTVGVDDGGHGGEAVGGGQNPGLEGVDDAAEGFG